VKHFAGGGAEEIRLDWQDLPPGCDVERGLSLLTGWVLAAEAEGLSYGLQLPGVDIPRGSGPAHRQRCLETLALWSPAGTRQP
jgi:uncharacterized protein (DUF58 family)